MSENPFQGPGDKDLKKIMGPDPKQPDPKKSDPKPKSSDESLVNGKGGGGLSADAQQTLEDRKKSNLPPEPPPETYDFPTIEKPKPEDPAKADTAVLSDAKWNEPDTLFHQEAEVSVKLSLPKGKEHLTKVQVELLAKTPSGPESISKGEDWAQADGTAVVNVPVYKPKGYVDGPVEYFFRVMHSLAKMLSTEKEPREVSEMALKSADHILIPGNSFEKDSSFIGPKGTQGLKPLETRFKEWEQKFPKKAQIAVYGHTDKDEKDAKGLSERRAQSAFAFITNDAAAWDNLYRAEKWGLKALQILLKDLGHYHGTPDGEDGPNTQAAFKAFQKSAGLPESGREDSTTRKVLFGAYMKGKHDIQIDASRFCQVAGNPWMGCAANNQARESDGAAPENRRVAFILINPNKHFPVNFPCQNGSEAACQGQCKKVEKRSTPGTKCLFYDELVREKTQEPVVENAADENAHATADRISFEGFGGRGYVIKDFKKFAGGAIQLNPEKIIPGGEALPEGFNNQCVSFVRYFGLPQTSSWKKGPRVCDFKPGELPEGTVVATLRDGKFYSDTSGRSHVGIYLSHEEYQGYLDSPNAKSGVWLMDQYFGARIDRRQKKYITNADEEKIGSPAKKAWIDPEGNQHENRVKWVDDGEEYFVVLTDQ